MAFTVCFLTFKSLIHQEFILVRHEAGIQFLFFFSRQLVNYINSTAWKVNICRILNLHVYLCLIPDFLLCSTNLLTYSMSVICFNCRNSEIRLTISYVPLHFCFRIFLALLACLRFFI